jgi:DNA-binding response OmpR family regulator
MSRPSTLEGGKEAFAACMSAGFPPFGSPVRERNRPFEGGPRIVGARFESRMNRPRVLLVDDELDILLLLRELFEASECEVREATNGREGLRALFEFRPDVVILDVAMPELDGWLTLERIRDLSDVPVIMLTARTADADKVRGLRAGADDYVTKPFNLDELLARTAAVLRRSWKRDELFERYDDGRLVVDLAERSATIAGRELPLTPLEFKLLSAFVRHRNELLSRDQLLQLVWLDPHRVAPDQVRLYVAYLRRKLERAGADGAPSIETVRGFGYRFRPAPAATGAAQTA